jgi:Ca2+-binding EF-hand superfamily protein
MARSPTKEEIETIFKAVDTDGDGFISVDELFNALGKTNFRKDEIEAVVGLLDKDGLKNFRKS